MDADKSVWLHAHPKLRVSKDLHVNIQIVITAQLLKCKSLEIFSISVTEQDILHHKTGYKAWSKHDPFTACLHILTYSNLLIY